MEKEKSIRERVYKCIQHITEEKGYSVIDDKMLFYEDLNFDSLDMIELQMEIEEEFHISTEDNFFAKAKSVGNVVAYLEKCSDI